VPQQTRQKTIPPTTDTGVIYCDDNRYRLASLPPESVDLIYLDPPFFSNRFYEVIWGDEAEVRSFEDRWEGGIQVYVNWMRDRVMLMRRLLKPSGALFLHADWHAGHHLRVMLDEVFGHANFRNEIIWHYKFRLMHNKRVLNRKHDNIFFYANSEAHRIKIPIEPWTREEIIRVRKQAIHKDKDGQEWVWMPGPKGRSKNKPKYLDDIIQEGKAMDDIWNIPIVSSSAKERMHYPTQKPEPLLERIIEMSCPEGGIVLDPFAGCGTTLVAAQRLRREWIGIDISPTAVNLMKRRMEKVGATSIELVNMPATEDQLYELKPFEFQNWVIQRFNGTYSPRKTWDMGVDGYSFFYHYPIQVKQSHAVGREVVDKFEPAIERESRDGGYIVGFSFTKGAYEEAARAKARKGVTIELVTVADLLRGAPELAIADLGQLLKLPLPPPRPPEAMPLPEELMASDRSA
jgi:DNA modification methylase